MDRLPPEDFIPIVTNSPATDAMAPLYSRSDSKSVFVGTSVRSRITPGIGLRRQFRTLHGDLKGLLAVQMAIDCIGPAALGIWLQFDPHVVYAGKTRGLIDALVFAGDTLVARASAAFRPVA